MADDVGPVVDGTLWGMLERRAAVTPGRLALADEHDRALTWAQLRVRSEQVAAGLLGLGIGPGTRVSWQLPTRIETILLSMALARLGAVQNPIIHLYREREVGSLLRTTRAQWYAVPGEWRGFDYAAMAERLQRGTDVRVLPAYENLPTSDPDSLPPPPVDGDEVCWLYSTSGTTSEPKAVCHSDGTLIAGGVGIAIALDPQPDDVGTICFPYAHIGGPDFFVMMLRTGLPAVLVEAFVPDEAYPLFRRHGVTITGGSTAHYLALLDHQARHAGAHPLPALRLLTGGGAPKPPELYWRVLEATGVPIAHGYGMTECPMVANGSPHDTDEQRANTDGAPVEGCEIRIVGALGEVLAPGADGEIQVRGPMLAKGYLEPADEDPFTADGWFRTGDRGHLRADAHLVVTGRTKELIIRKGENVSPREVEDVLMTHPSVGAVAVIGLPDEQRGERVCAVIETAFGAEPLSFAAMVEHCRASGLMTQKIPEQLEIVERLPRNPTMKILKRVLVERFTAGENG